MGIYSIIYNNLCNEKCQLKELYKSGSGLHRHHIIPRHMGGSDDESNFTYLTIREHIIAHFLLWKIHKNINDLRSMKMLGAELTVEQRKVVGIYCRDNKIGFHRATKEQRKEWQLKGIESQKLSSDTNSWYWWSTEEGQKKRASMGGSVGSASQIKNKQGIHTSDLEKRNEWASLGGKSHKGKRCMYIPGETTFKRVKPEDIESFLNKGYIFGSPYKGKNQYTKSSF